jgi:hypothetical protein
MEKITHNEFQLISSIVCLIAFFAFAGLVYFIEALNNKNK